MVNEAAIRIFTGMVMAFGEGLRKEYQEAYQETVRIFRMSVLGEGVIKPFQEN